MKLELKIFGSQTKTSEIRLTNRVQEMEGRNLGIKEKIEAIKNSGKENAKSKNFIAKKKYV